MVFGPGPQVPLAQLDAKWRLEGASQFHFRSNSLAADVIYLLGIQLSLGMSTKFVPWRGEVGERIPPSSPPLKKKKKESDDVHNTLLDISINRWNTYTCHPEITKHRSVTRTLHVTSVLCLVDIQLAKIRRRPNA